MESTFNPTFLLLVVGGISAVAVVLFILLRRSGRAPAAGGNPPQYPQAPSVVLGKRTYNWPDRLGHYVTFQTQGNPPIELEVSPEWYAFLNPGDRGALVLQGGQFGGFQKAG